MVISVLKKWQLRVVIIVVKKEQFSVVVSVVNPLTPEFSEKNLQRIGRDHKNVIAGCYFNVDIAIHTFLKSIIIVDLTQFFPVDFSNYMPL